MLPKLQLNPASRRVLPHWAGNPAHLGSAHLGASSRGAMAAMAGGGNTKGGSSSGGSSGPSATPVATPVTPLLTPGTSGTLGLPATPSATPPPATVGVSPKDFPRRLAEVLSPDEQTTEQEDPEPLLDLFCEAYHRLPVKVDDPEDESKHKLDQSEYVNGIIPATALRVKGRYSIKDSRGKLTELLDKKYSMPELNKEHLYQLMCPGLKSDNELNGMHPAARMEIVASSLANGYPSPISVGSEEIKMHRIRCNDPLRMEKVQNTLLPLHLLADSDRIVTGGDTLGDTLNTDGKGCKRAALANSRKEGHEVAYFNGKKVELPSLSMRTRRNELLVFVDEDNVLGRNPPKGKDENRQWTYIKVKEVIPDEELVDIMHLAEAINPSLQVYFLIVACGFKVYIVEKLKEQANIEKKAAKDNRDSSSPAYQAKNRLLPCLEVFLRHMRMAVENNTQPGMKIERLDWEKWNFLKDASPGTRDFTWSRFHIATIILLSSGRSDEVCRNAYSSVMAGKKGPRDLLDMMKNDRRGRRTLGLCDLLEALHESLRKYSLGLSCAQSLLNAAVLSCLYFDGGFPTDEILILSMEQFNNKKCRIIRNSISDTFGGVGPDSHVIQFVSTLAEEMGIEGVTNYHIDHIVCDGNHISEDVGYYCNELIGQIKQWKNLGKKGIREQQVCRQIIEALKEQNPLYGRVMEKWLRLP